MRAHPVRIGCGTALFGMRAHLVRIRRPLLLPRMSADLMGIRRCLNEAAHQGYQAPESKFGRLA